MASSMIHLAITKSLSKEFNIKSAKRFLLGCVLPDGVIHGNGHLKIRICEETRSTYDLESYRERFGNKMLEDDLYLGYYLHLIQDMFYRRLVYSKYHWNPMIPGNMDRLHQDYRITNGYVSRKYNLRAEDLEECDLNGEEILSIATFDVNTLVQGIKQQFLPVKEKECFFFTKDMADEFIEMAIPSCRDEMTALIKGREGICSADWSWERHS